MARPQDLELQPLNNESVFKRQQLREPLLSGSENSPALSVADNPRKAVSFFIFSSVLMTMNQYASQGLIFRNPGMSIMQMTFARGVAASLVMLVWINKDIGNVMFGQVQASCWPSLIFRCFQGALSLFNGFLLLKYFYVSTITIVCALTPIFTVILAYFIFGS